MVEKLLAGLLVLVVLGGCVSITLMVLIVLGEIY